MSSSNTDHWTTGECIELLNFLIEKTENVKSPMNIYHLATEFKEESISPQTSSLVYSRICNARQTIQKMEGIKDETKVKVLFALSAPIEAGFLIKLKEHADVLLDDHQRIIEYKKKGLELSGAHKITTLPDSALYITPFIQKPIIDWSKTPEYTELTNFLIEKTRNVKSVLPVERLATAFKEINGSPQTVGCLRGRINRLRPVIHRMKHIDMDTRVKMMFALSVPISTPFLDELKTQAIVEVDARNRITKYVAIDGSLTLKGDHRRSAKVREGWAERIKHQSHRNDRIMNGMFYVNSEFDSENEINLYEAEDHLEQSTELNHLEKESENVITRNGMISKKRSLDIIPSSQKQDSSRKRPHIAGNSSSLNELEDYDRNYDDFRISEVNVEPFRGSLIAPIDTDEDIKVIPESELHKPKKEVEDASIDIEIMGLPVKIDSEYIELLNFLIEKTENVISPMSIYQLAAEFKEKSTSSQTFSLLYLRICNSRQSIQRIEGINDETKVKLLFALSAPIDTECLQKLKIHADVVLDRHQRIIEYKKKGGGFELSGTHKVIETPPNTARVPQRLLKVAPMTEWVTSPEYIELTNFLIEKTRNVKSLLGVGQLAMDFKEFNESSEALQCLCTRIQRLRPVIHRLEHIPMDTRVKMLFALSVPISTTRFLDELKNQADVILDEQNKIIKYSKKGGGLELRLHDNAKIEIEEMMKFLAQKAMESNSPISDSAFAREFKKLTKSSGKIENLVNRFNFIKYKIYEYDGVDEQLKIRMLLVSGVRLSNPVLKKLRKDAFVEVDDQNRITNYVANDGSLTLEGDHSMSAKLKRSWTEKKKNERHGSKCSCDSDSKDVDKMDNEGFYLKIELDSDDEYYLDRTEDHVESSKKTNDQEITSESRKRSEFVTTKNGRVPKKRSLDTITSPQKRDSGTKRFYIAQKPSPINELEDYDPNHNNFQIPEVKLKPFRGSLIYDFAPMDQDDDFKVIPGIELCEPEKEIEEAQTDFGTMEVPIKTEEDFIIPKLEELEEEDIKPELI